MKALKELHAISPENMPLEAFIGVAKAIHPFTTAIHLRYRDLSAAELWTGIQTMMKAGVPADKIYVNDRLDAAWSAGAKGIHLGHRSLPVHEVVRLPHVMRVGCSVHSVEEAVKSAASGAQYLFYGHVFETACKPGRFPVGLDTLSMAVQAVHIPVIAIGGIGVDQAEQVIACGVSGIAVMSGIAGAPDPVAAAKRYAEKLGWKG